MADVRFCVGFSKACKQAREGGGLAGYEGRASRGRALRPFLPPDIIRLIDALVRRLEHEDTLLAMNGGELGTTLCEAAAAGGILDVRFLLLRGADVEASTVFIDENGRRLEWTALLWAVRAGHAVVCAALLDANADERDPALSNAARYGHTPVVALLLDRGADIEDENGDVLIQSAEFGHLATTTLLLDRGADVHAQEDKALALAAQCGHLEIVRLLLDRGADIQSRNGQPLVNAALKGRLEMVRLLLDRGADIHADNEVALRGARQEGHAAVEALLLERGALEPEED